MHVLKMKIVVSATPISLITVIREGLKQCILIPIPSQSPSATLAFSLTLLANLVFEIAHCIGDARRVTSSIL
jgi:hypothetical protein